MHQTKRLLHTVIFSGCALATIYSAAGWAQPPAGNLPYPQDDRYGPPGMPAYPGYTRPRDSYPQFGYEDYPPAGAYPGYPAGRRAYGGGAYPRTMEIPPPPPGYESTAPAPHGTDIPEPVHPAAASDQEPTGRVYNLYRKDEAADATHPAQSDTSTPAPVVAAPAEPAPAAAPEGLYEKAKAKVDKLIGKVPAEATDTAPVAESPATAVPVPVIPATPEPATLAPVTATGSAATTEAAPPTGVPAAAVPVPVTPVMSEPASAVPAGPATTTAPEGSDEVLEKGLAEMTDAAPATDESTAVAAPEIPVTPAPAAPVEPAAVVPVPATPLTPEAAAPAGPADVSPVAPAEPLPAAEPESLYDRVKSRIEELREPESAAGEIPTADAKPGEPAYLPGAPAGPYTRDSAVDEAF